MVSEYDYINIKEILSRLLKHPLMQDVDLEQVIQHTIDFIGIFGMPKIYKTKEDTVEINDFRGVLPCDLVSINQVKDCYTGICMRSMTDTFIPKDSGAKKELSYKTQGRVIYTSMKEGDVLISYNAIPVDDDGLPLLIDNPVFIRTLEAYIKKEVFTVLFDLGKIQPQVLQNAQQDYAFKAGQCRSEFLIPSVSEMESLSRMWNTLLPNTDEFDKGFTEMGNREMLRKK